MNQTSSQLENELVKSLIDDRRRDRVWRNIRFFVWIFIILIVIILLFAPSSKISVPTGKPYVSLIRLNGVIMPQTKFSADRVIPLLNKAFADSESKGVILLINSPGGSAVQASIIHDRILYLKQKYKKKVVVIGVDVLASGAYLIASAADKIYVNKDTITGSIGVIMSGFGLNDAIQKLGITRRVFTAGANKDRLDPFQPLNPQDVAKVQNLLNTAHQNFIADVVQGRGNRLRGDKTELFSGDFWSGQKAVELGLADGTDNLTTAMQSDFGVRHYKNYSAKQSVLDSIIKGAETELHLGLTDQQPGVQALLPGV